MSKKSLYVDLKVGQSMTIDGGRIVITLEAKSGQRAQLRIEADKKVQVQVPRNPVQIQTGAAQALGGIKASVPA